LALEPDGGAAQKTGAMGQQRRPHYLSYLLRLWQTSDGETWVWRASLETPGTGERRGFGSLKDLFEFLQAQTKAECEEMRDTGNTQNAWERRF